MTSALSLLGLIVLVFVTTAIECRAVPDTDTLTPLMLDSMGNPIMILRDKRGSYQGYPSRTMMFTGFYRPPRRSGSSSQATSVYAEGNAIGGGAYFSQPVYLADGPDPANDDDVASSVAEAHPPNEDEEHAESAAVKPQDNEMEDDQQKQPVSKPSKGQKKGKNFPIDENDDDEYDDEDDEEYYKSSRPRGRKYRPANNYFPMVFSFPASTGRRGSSSASGSGGPVTAVANSYSTSKGGVASSVATAYGGSSMKKPRRRYSSYVN